MIIYWKSCFIKLFFFDSTTWRSTENILSFHESSKKESNLLSIYLGLENRFSFFYLHFALPLTNVLVLNSSKSTMVEDDYNFIYLSIYLRDQ